MNTQHRSPSLTIEQSFKLHYIPLLYYAWRILNDRQAAEDVVMDVWVKLITGGRPIDDHPLFRIVHNACLNYLQHEGMKERRLRTLPEVDEVAQLDAEVFAHIARALAGLPAQTRRVVTMRFWGGLTNPQIAGKLGISVHTVRNQIVRGLKLLRNDSAFKA